MFRFMRRLILLGGAFAACSLHAHPGHSPLGHGVSHALLSLYHFLSLLAVGAILFVVGKVVQRRLPSLVLKSFGAVVLAIGATGLLLAL